MSIRTTHVGSLPRSALVADLLFGQEKGLQFAPDDLVLIPGCLDSTTNFVEHPELVAQRLERFVGAVGKARMMAGTDCGFSTFAGFGVVDPTIVWAKLGSLVEGARLASSR